MEQVETEVLIPQLTQEQARIAFEAVAALLSKHGIRNQNAIELWNNYNILVGAGLLKGELWTNRNDLVAKAIRFVDPDDRALEVLREHSSSVFSAFGVPPDDSKNLSTGMAIFFSFIYASEGECLLFPEIHHIVSRFGETIENQTTRKLYARAVRGFLEYCDTKRIDAENVTEKDAERYLKRLSRKKPESVLRLTRAALHRFLKSQAA